MKKYFMLFTCCLFLIACGKNYKTYSEQEKEEMYDAAYKEQENGNSEKMNYIKELISNLEIASKEGHNIAEKELEEWKVTKLFYYVPTSDPNYKIDFNNKKW